MTIQLQRYVKVTKV